MNDVNKAAKAVSFCTLIKFRNELGNEITLSVSMTENDGTLPDEVTAVIEGPDTTGEWIMTWREALFLNELLQEMIEATSESNI